MSHDVFARDLLRPVDIPISSSTEGDRYFLELF